MASSRQEDLLEANTNTGSSRRTTLKKILITIGSLAVVACVAVVAVAGTTSSSAEPRLPELSSVVKKNLAKLPVYEIQNKQGAAEDICFSEECVLAAADIINALDKSIDPCDDFFQFACGGWIKKNPVPDESSSWGSFDILERSLSNALSTILKETANPTDPLPLNQAKDFYKGCVNTSFIETIGLKPFTSFLEQFGGWPIATEGWDSDNFNWQSTVAEGRSQIGSNSFINIWVSADQKDTMNNALFLDQTSLGLPRSVLVDSDNFKDLVMAYKTYIKDTAIIVATSLGVSYDDDVLNLEIDDVMAFEITLAGITTPDEERRDIERMYNPMLVADLSTLTPDSSIAWQELLATAFKATGVTIEDTTRVIVQEVEYLKKMAALVESTPPRVLSNYLVWRFVMSLGDETNQAMRDASFKYQVVANGVTAAPSRSRQCVDKSNNFLGFALATKYVESYFTQQAKDEASQMVEDIRASFKELLVQNTWMDAETQPKAVEKADAISKSIGYPDWFENSTALEAYYERLGEIAVDQHFQNVLSISAWSSLEELNEFGKPTDRAAWWRAPTIVNAWYSPEYNSITFPAGILQPPFYRASSLQALNYGGIGQVIGHEITHGFDDQGSQYDKNGNAIPWWNNATIDAFKEKAQCIIDQYSGFQVPELDGAPLNGVNTQGENIADNGGIRQAYGAYLKYIERNGEEPKLPGLEDYSPRQLFFLSNANIWCGTYTREGLLNQVLTNVHSPAKYRVLGPNMNMAEFSENWNCPVGSPMNPENKCIVW